MVVRRLNGSLHVSKEFEMKKIFFDRENYKVVSAMNDTGTGRPWDTRGGRDQGVGEGEGCFPLLLQVQALGCR